MHGREVIPDTPLPVTARHSVTAAAQTIARLSAPLPAPMVGVYPVWLLTGRILSSAAIIAVNPSRLLTERRDEYSALERGVIQ